MGNRKLFAWQQKTLVLLVATAGSFSISSMMSPTNPHLREATTSEQTTKTDTLNAKAGTKQRIERLKSTMMGSWQQTAQAKSISFNVPARFQGATINQATLSKNDKVIALTFDDGPWPDSTVEVLNILQKNDIKATFFMVGQYLNKYPELGQKVAAGGHAIGNHTWHHWYHHFNHQAAAFEIDRTTEIIYKTTGTKTSLFRPPGGMLNNGLAAYAKQKKYAIVMWSDDSKDYKNPAVEHLVKNSIKQAKPGGIVLLHDGGGNRSRTVQALPKIIAHFKGQGYRFVTVPELLAMQDQHQKLVAAKAKK